MSRFGEHWKIDGVQAAFVRCSGANGRYWVLFERDNASIEDIEGINWKHPDVVHTDTRDPDEPGLPKGYGFDVIRITYDSNNRSYTVELQVAEQYLGDVTGYQTQIEELQAAATEKDSTIAQLESEAAEKDATIQSQAETIESMEAAGTAETVKTDLQAAYAEGVESNG